MGSDKSWHSFYLPLVHQFVFDSAVIHCRMHTRLPYWFGKWFIIDWDPFDLDPSKPAPQLSSAVHFLDPDLLPPCPAHASPWPMNDQPSKPILKTQDLWCIIETYYRNVAVQYVSTCYCQMRWCAAFTCICSFAYFTSYNLDVLGLNLGITEFQDYAGAKPSKPATPGLPWMHIACTSKDFSTKGLHQVLLRCWTRISIL